MAQKVKYLPAMQETQVQSLGGQDPLEKRMATHAGILAWRIPWTEEPGGLRSTGLHRVRHDCSDLAHTRARCLYVSAGFQCGVAVITLQAEDTVSFIKPALPSRTNRKAVATGHIPLPLSCWLPHHPASPGARPIGVFMPLFFFLFIYLKTYVYY